MHTCNKKYVLIERKNHKRQLKNKTGKIKKQILIKIFNLAKQNIYHVVLTKFFIKIIFFIQSNDNRNIHTH